MGARAGKGGTGSALGGKSPLPPPSAQGGSGGDGASILAASGGVFFSGVGHIGDGQAAVYGSLTNTGSFPEGSPAVHPFSDWTNATPADFFLDGGAGGGGEGGDGQGYLLPVGILHHFTIWGAPTKVAGSSTFTVVVSPRDRWDNPVTGYTGTIRFSSSDRLAQLPADYMFDPSDQGVHLFSIGLNTPGSQTLAVTATSGGITDRVPITVTPPNWSGPRWFSTTPTGGANPFAVAAGDLNGDGNLDLVAPDFQGGCVDVLLGNGDGSFQAAQAFSTGPDSFPRDLAVGDLNGDGILDIVTADSGGNAVSVLLGNGDGSFQAPVIYPVGGAAYRVVLGDFAGNGTLDVVAVDPDHNGISILLGNGDGTFQPAVHYAAGPEPTSVTAGDFYGDGILDLAVTNTSTNRVTLLRGNGDGTFRPGGSLAVGRGPVAVAAGHLLGEGNLDLVVADRAGNDVSVWTGNGDGTFRSAGRYAVGPGLSRVALADLTGDGVLDLVMTNSATANSAVTVFLGNGDGTFSPAMPLAAGTFPTGLAVGDFRNSGTPDVAVTNDGQDGTVSLLANGANPGFDHVATLAPDFVTAGEPASLAVTAQDAFGDTLADYTGTVHFSSTDPLGADLPRDYTFSSADQGTQVFSVRLYTAGRQSITVTDTDRGVRGTVTITVQPAQADGFMVRAPLSVSSAVPFDVTVVAVDAYGNLDTGYGGTVMFTTSDADPRVILPPHYTFQPSDHGMVAFVGGVTLITPGNQRLSVSDAQGLAGLATVTVFGGGAPAGGRQRLPTGLAGRNGLTQEDAQPARPTLEPAHRSSPQGAHATTSAWRPEQVAAVDVVFRQAGGAIIPPRAPVLVRLEPHSLDEDWLQMPGSSDLPIA